MNEERISFTKVSATPSLAEFPCDGGRHGPAYLLDPIGDSYCARCGWDMTGNFDEDDEEEDDEKLIGEIAVVALLFILTVLALILLPDSLFDILRTEPAKLPRWMPA